MRLMLFFMLLCASFLLSNCAQNSHAYLHKGNEISSIVIPPGVPMVKQDNLYPVPPMPSDVKPVSLTPPTFM